MASGKTFLTKRDTKEKARLPPTCLWFFSYKDVLYQAAASTLPPRQEATLSHWRLRNGTQKMPAFAVASLHHSATWDHISAEFLSDVKLPSVFCHFQFISIIHWIKRNHLKPTHYSRAKETCVDQDETADSRTFVCWVAHPWKEFRNWQTAHSCWAPTMCQTLCSLLGLQEWARWTRSLRSWKSHSGRQMINKHKG